MIGLRKGLQSLIFSIKREGLVSQFYLYPDESGKLGNSDYTSLCGFLAHDAEWARIEIEWNALGLKWSIPPVHMRLIRYPERDKSSEWTKIKESWGDHWEGRRDAMLNDFANLIYRSSAVCVGTVVDAASFRALPVEGEFRKQMQDPLYLGFFNCVMAGIEKITFFAGDHGLGIVLDDDEDYSLRCYQVLNAIRKQLDPKVRRHTNSICFANDDAFPALQAADMIAYESRRHMIGRNETPNLPPSDLYLALTRNGLHQPKLYDATLLDLHVKEFDKNRK